MISDCPGDINDVYLALYDYLVKKKVIKAKIKLVSVWTADYVHIINKPFIDEHILREKINKKNSDYPELLKCYEINYSKLSHFLKNYKYTFVDVPEIAKLLEKRGGTRNFKSRTRKNTSRRKSFTKQKSMKRLYEKKYNYNIWEQHIF